MEQRFVIWLHCCFCNVISLTNTPLKSSLISSQLMELIYIIVIEQKYLWTCAHIELKETKKITHFPLLKAHPH